MTATSILIPVRACIKCGARDRDKRGGCNPCIKVRSLAWLLANRDKAKATASAWYAKNHERKKEAVAAWVVANIERVKASRVQRWAKDHDKCSTAAAAWRTANPERVKEYAATYSAAHTEARRVMNHNRNARKKENGGVLSKGLSAKLFKLQKGKCPCCKQPLGDDFHLDHKMPISLGGQNVDDNIQLLRSICNLQKKAKHPVDFMQSRGFLL